MTSLKFNGYRIDSNRYKIWNYAQTASYFITICTQNRKHYFGTIQSGGKMILNPLGKLIATEWNKTPSLRPYTTLDEWIIMPNHFHAILTITPPASIVQTHCNASLRKNTFGPQSHNLASIIRGFKGATTKQIHLAGYPDFAWQPNYYDHIIRSTTEFTRIKKYIQQNPLAWYNRRMAMRL